MQPGVFRLEQRDVKPEHTDRRMRERPRHISAGHPPEAGFAPNVHDKNMIR